MAAAAGAGESRPAPALTGHPHRETEPARHAGAADIQEFALPGYGQLVVLIDHGFALRTPRGDG